ncbi:hypothetical protein MUP77_22555 [Candidatus Bathyarchaeota archaeon]|nr:hypothetical protein [Candidatus Bathyarchaeota archaeon]
MVSYTIDFIASIVVVTVLLTSSIIIVAQDLNRAVIYQQDQQIFLKASDILNNVLQNTGYPQDWGQTNATPRSFGLDIPYAEYITPSPFTPLRLIQTNEKILYNSVEYRNLTTGNTHLFLRSSEYINYNDAAELLAVENDFGFLISITPVLNISISQIRASPLKIGISVQGPSGGVAGASLNASLFYVKKSTPYPSISNPIRSQTISNISGGAEIDFPGINADDTSYIALLKANTGGTVGVSYYTNTYSMDSSILPFVTNYSEGEISLVHRKDITTSYAYDGAAYYNLTFINQLGKTDFQSVKLGNPYGTVDTNNPKIVSLSVGSPGILLVSSKTAGGYELTTMPWGITPLCLHMTYGADPINKKTVVKTSQFVSISGLSYKIEVALWRFNAEN